MSLFAAAAVLIILTATLVIWLWDKIRNFYIFKVQPWLTEKFSAETRSCVDNVFLILNRGASFTRNAARQIWNTFIRKVRFYRTRWRELPNGELEEETQIKVQKESDPSKVIVQTTVETVSRDELPLDVRTQISNTPDGVHEADNLDVCHKKIQEEIQELEN